MGGVFNSWRNRLAGAVAATIAVPAFAVGAQVAGAPVAAQVADFTCTADADGVSWTPTAASRYHVRRALDGPSEYLGSSDSLRFDTDARYGTFTVISYTGGRRETSCVGPFGAVEPTLTCSVDGTTLTWTDTGASRYFVRRALDGVDAYLGVSTETSMEVPLGGVYTVVTWSGGTATRASCVGAPVVAAGPQLVWKTNDDKAPFSMNLLRTTDDPRGDLLRVENLQLMSGRASFVTLDGNRLSVDPSSLTGVERPVFTYDIVGEPGIVYRSTATIIVSDVNDAPVDRNEVFRTPKSEPFEIRSGVESTIDGFDFGGRGGIAVEGSGRATVADTRRHRLRVCDPDTPCTTVGGFGEQAGRFIFPVALAIGPRRSLWVGDTGNNRIQRCNRNGKQCEVWQHTPPGSTHPTADTGPVLAIAFADAEHLVFASNTAMTRCHIDGSACVELVPADATSDDVITQIAIAPGGRAVVADAAFNLTVCENVLSALDPECRSNVAPRQPGRLDDDALPGVAIDQKGQLVVSDPARSQLLTCEAEGVRCRRLVSLADSVIGRPEQLGVDAAGSIYVLDTRHNDVHVIVRRGLLANANDADGDIVEVSAVFGDPAAVGVPTRSRKGATFTVHADGALSYDPTGSLQLQRLQPGETAIDTIRYTVSDGRGGLDTAQFNVRVTG